MLTKAIASEIVEQTMNRLRRNVNIMNQYGIIIASGDSSRIGDLHAGASEVLRTGEPLIVTAENMNQWQGSFPGLNLPIQFQNQIIGVIGITGHPYEIMEFGELVKMITEMMIQQAFVASQMEWKQRLKELVFDDLVHGEPGSETVKQRLSLLGIKLEAPYQVTLIEISNDERSFKDRDMIQKLENILPASNSLIGFLNVNHVFMLTSADVVGKKINDVIALLELWKIPFRIGVGSSVDDVAHICESLEESKCSLRFGSREQRIITYTEVETRAFIEQVDERMKRLFAERILKQSSIKLIDTLEHFFAANLNIGECAKNMYIHRNSLIYRLKKIKEETGYDPQLFQDAVSLQIAVWVHNLNHRSRLPFE